MELITWISEYISCIACRRYFIILLSACWSIVGCTLPAARASGVKAQHFGSRRAAARNASGLERQMFVELCWKSRAVWAGKQQLQPSAAEQHYPAACLASIVGMFGFECWFPHGRERKHFFHAGKGWRRVKLKENISAWDIYMYAYTYTSEHTKRRPVIHTAVP